MGSQTRSQTITIFSPPSTVLFPFVLNFSTLCLKLKLTFILCLTRNKKLITHPHSFLLPPGTFCSLAIMSNSKIYTQRCREVLWLQGFFEALYTDRDSREYFLYCKADLNANLSDIKKHMSTQKRIEKSESNTSAKRPTLPLLKKNIDSSKQAEAIMATADEGNLLGIGSGDGCKLARRVAWNLALIPCWSLFTRLWVTSTPTWSEFLQDHLRSACWWRM